MNRLKLWLFAALVVGAAALTLRVISVQLRDTALRTLDARLHAGASRLAAAERVLSSEATAVVTLAARDARLAGAFQPREASPEPVAPPRGRRAAVPVLPAPALDAQDDEAARQEAARAALTGAEQALGFSLPTATEIIAGNAGSIAAAQVEGDDRQLSALLERAAQGSASRGWIRREGALWYAAAAPVARDAALVLLVPVDASWLAAASRGTGAELTLGAAEAPVVSVLAAPEARSLTAAALASAGSPGGAGRLAAVPLRVAGFSQQVELLFAKAPAHRVLAVPLAELEGGFAVLSTPTRPLLAPLVEFQWLVVTGLGVVLLVGLLFGLLVHPTEVAAAVPPELVAAASRIERGEFGARAPVLAGKVGTVAAALNRAAEAAEAAAAAAAAPAPVLGQEAAPAEADPSAFDFPSREPLRAEEPLAPPAAPEPLPAAPEPFAFGADAAPAGPFSAGPDPFSAGSDPFAPPPLSPEPLPAAPPELPAAPEPPPFTGLTQRLDRAGPDAFDPPAPPPFPSAPPPPFAEASPPELLQNAALAAPPADAELDGDAAHWREVFEDFVRTRGECGEAAQGISFEKFRQKLETNRASLVAKYGCRTVRFQVYVKEGKAALKATPVR